VVDDDPAMRTLLVDALGEDGYQVTGASNTLTALLYLLRTKVSLVVLDWKMPDLDGFVLLDTLRRIAPRVPVIFVTAYDQPEVCRRALEAGARGFLAKPFPVSRLLVEIEKALVNPPGPSRVRSGPPPEEEV
jgi:DNA-binding response OmpR family regulator